MDEKYKHKNDGRVPIMPPIRDGYPPPICEDPPSDQEVLRAMPRVARGVPYVYEEFRDDIVIVKNRLVDKIDPPRFFPLVGPGPAAPLPLGMRDLLHRDDPERLPVPGKITKQPGPGHLHRQGPPAPVRGTEPRRAAADHAGPDQVLMRTPPSFVKGDRRTRLRKGRVFVRLRCGAQRG